MSVSSRHQTGIAIQDYTRLTLVQKANVGASSLGPVFPWLWDAARREDLPHQHIRACWNVKALDATMPIRGAARPVDESLA